MLAHEEDQYTDFLSIALKQTKAGRRILGTPFLVLDENRVIPEIVISHFPHTSLY